MDNKVDVVEVTYCNSRSVAEHIVMMILSLVRDYHNQHSIVKAGGWNMTQMEFKDHMMWKVCMSAQLQQGIGLDALRKMKPFDVHLHYFDSTSYQIR